MNAGSQMNLKSFAGLPAYFWALEHNLTADYTRAGAPILPTITGYDAAAREILICSGLLVAASGLPCVPRVASTACGAVTALCLLFLTARRVNRTGIADRILAGGLRRVSIGYSFVLFAARPIDRITKQLSYVCPSQDEGTVRTITAKFLRAAVRGARKTVNLREA